MIRNRLKLQNLNSNFFLTNGLYHSKTGVYGYNQRKGKILYSKPEKQIQKENCSVFQLISAYRDYGHLKSSLSLFEHPTPKHSYIFDPKNYNLDLNDPKLFLLEDLMVSERSEMAVKDIIDHLERIYCRNIGVETQHIDLVERDWFAHQFETQQLKSNLSNSVRKSVAECLVKSQVFDRFLATKFATVKRYGAEGAESMLTFFQTIFRQSANFDVSDILIGIPHRGRLNLLSLLLNFPPALMFRKIKGLSEIPDGIRASGDVLSHLSICTSLLQQNSELCVTLLPNPSHLEAVSPVVVGKARSMLQSRGLGEYSVSSSANQIVPIQVHGDAAFAGQGVIMETLAMSSVPHFNVGGSIHLVVNNQLGFTTPHDRGRSSTYCSDVMKMIDAPIIHVNGYFPEEVVKAAELALQYRQTFQKDILVDLMCFRRWGHNEMDDPTFTNPTMYNVIGSLKSVPDQYCEELRKEGIFTDREKEDLVAGYNSSLNAELKNVESYKPEFVFSQKNWSSYVQADESLSVWDTSIPVDVLKYVGIKSITFPDNMVLHPTLVKHFISDRKKKISNDLPLDWATAEALAFGSLLYQGFNIRLSGQDVGRGTFSHRHAMVIDQSNGEIYIPFNYISSDQKAFLEVANSILSEEAVVSFEYGFSIDNPKNLVIWEAQFGDFFNSAQVVFDTFISSTETKWMLQSGLVILLPHGYDGAGPEHSSCRMERFLQMCDSKEDSIDSDQVNWCVAFPTTPAQYFHLLRRQVLSKFRRPLIVIAPKILLRHPEAVSDFSEMAQGATFNSLLDDKTVTAKDVTKILFCTGKHYYLLNKEKMLRKNTETAIVRIEELCPFPAKELSLLFNKYKNAKHFVWSQEEHRNMGAWSFVNTRFQNILGYKLRYAGRKVHSTPAVGVAKIHQEEVLSIMEQTFTDSN